MEFNSTEEGSVRSQENPCSHPSIHGKHEISADNVSDLLSPTVRRIMGPRLHPKKVGVLWEPSLWIVKTTGGNLGECMQDYETKRGRSRPIGV